MPCKRRAGCGRIRGRLTPLRRDELDRFGAACRARPEMAGMVEALFDRLLPRGRKRASSGEQSGSHCSRANGFDREQHERIRSDLKRGLIGLAQNRLPAIAVIEDVQAGDVVDTTGGVEERYRTPGPDALAAGEVAVVTLAAGAGSRWTQGAGVVKALHPFCKLGGQHRTFLEVHLAKSRRRGPGCGSRTPRRHHELLDARPDRGSTASSSAIMAIRDAASIARPVQSDCA